MNPKVSVLMSCYNASRWLHEAIDSVVAQTFEDFELILVDDGSSDDTRSIIESYRDRDRRIVAIFKGNTGLADSLNIGIAEARGAWIARLDADDLCEPTRIEEQVDFVSLHPQIVLLGTGCFEIDEHGRVIKKYLYPMGHRKLVQHLERLKRFFPHSSAFYRTDVVKQAGGYRRYFRRSQDWRLWLDLTLHGRIACIPKPLVRIRRHSGQVSLENDSRRQLCDGTAGTVCHFLRKAGCHDPSASINEGEWITFLNWVENRIEETDSFRKHKAWTDARSQYFTAGNRWSGLLRIGVSLLQTGHAGSQVWGKFFGSSLPEQLAREWTRSRPVQKSIEY